MTESNEELLAKLEQATGLISDNSVLDKPLDDETAMLRESWDALSDLLNAADEAAPVLAQPSANVGTLKTVVRVFTALAAMLLVAVAAWAVLSQPTDSEDSPDRSTDLIVESNVEPESEAIANASDSSRGDNVIEKPVDEFAWNDSFDEQLAATSQAIRSARSDWSGGSRHYSTLLDQFEQFSEELNEGSL